MLQNGIFIHFKKKRDFFCFSPVFLLVYSPQRAKKRQKNARFDFSTCLAEEILDASRKLGQARQKRDELHRLAQQNRAYTRYRWW